MNEQLLSGAVGQAEGSEPGNRMWLWAAIAGLLTVLVIALGGAFWLQRTPGEGSAEAVFARDMIAHHEQAVQMALLIGARTADEELRLMAQDMVLTQQTQIGMMTAWLDLWGLPFAGPSAPMNGMGAMMGMAAQSDVNNLSSLPLTEAEILFFQLMIRHHQGGVIMAETALAESGNQQVTRMARAIVEAQQSEIDAMQAMLAARGGAAPEPVLPMDHGGHSMP